eukprot:GFYU01000565.1.p1 GENE.GFYU01000565.1~~GFYU01000565.1.p1  ORF type:complete len:389 (+),score=103.13 GFYU01000565.1:74-1240(+)
MGDRVLKPAASLANLIPDDAEFHPNFNAVPEDEEVVDEEVPVAVARPAPAPFKRADTWRSPQFADAAARSGFTSIRDFLKSTTVQEVLPDESSRRKVQWIDCNAPLERALKIMGDNFITSCPVMEDNYCIGMVDTLDSALYLIDCLSGDLKLGDLVRTSSQTNLDLAKAFSLAPVKKVMNYSGRNPLRTLTPDATLLEVCETLANGPHRIPIVGDKGELLMIFSQSTLCALVYQALDTVNDAIKGRSLKDLGLGLTKPVKTMNEQRSSVSAFRYLAECRLRCLVITNADGQLTHHLDAGAVAGLSRDSFSCLVLPVKDFLMVKMGGDSSKYKVDELVQNSDSMHALLEVLVRQKKHRAFVVDDGQKPTSIVTMTDVMQTFLMDPGSFS